MRALKLILIGTSVPILQGPLLWQLQISQAVRTVALLVWCITVPRLATYGGEFYVATNGNDGWSGQLSAPNSARTDGPFASLQRARDTIRTQKQAGRTNEPHTVYVREGTYELRNGLKLEALDGGSATAPVTYRAYRDEKPALIGGATISCFEPYNEAILKADLRAQGLKDVYFRQLFFNGQRQHLARYPNFNPENPVGGGWAYADGALVPMYSDVPGENKRSFTVREQDVREWADPDRLEVFVFARYNWWNDICGVHSIDRSTRRVTLAKDASYPIRPGDRYFFQNALEELDAPGEWYLDARTSNLYFWQPLPVKGKSVVAPTTRTILELGDGVAFVTIRGFSLEFAEGTAISLRNTTNCLVAANTIRNVGDYSGSGVMVRGGFRNGVVGNDISKVGCHGISLSGGDRKSLRPAENYAENNYIHHVGVFYKQGVGVAVEGVGNRVSHNLIHDGPRMGIIFSGNNLTIEYNHIRHMNIETEDTGAIYTGGRDWISSRGSVIRYNYIHDMLGYGRDENGRWLSPHFAWGIYLDDNTGGVDVIGNIIARCTRAGLHLHNGRDNHVENNVFIENGEQQLQYSGWTASHRMWKEHLPTMVRGYEMVASQPAWGTMRNLTLHPTNAPLPDGTIMTGNKFVRNIVYYSDLKSRYFRAANVPFHRNVIDSNLIWHFGLPLLTGQKSLAFPSNEWAAWQELGLDRHSIVADPLFINPTKSDFRLRLESPAFQLGFRAIPVDKIGPYRDELRASWPIHEERGVREGPLITAAPQEQK